MQATLNAIGMIALILLSITALLRFPKASRSERRPFPAIAIAVTYALLGTVFFSHLCDAGNPYLQVVVPALFLAAVLYLLRPPARSRFAIAIAVLGVVLTVHAVDAIHNGFPMRESRSKSLVTQMRIASAIRLNVDRTDLPAGAIPPEILQEADVTLDPHGRVLVSDIRARWYTFLTGMYEQYDAAKLAHYDGGPTASIDAREIRLIDPAD